MQKYERIHSFTKRTIRSFRKFEVRVNCLLPTNNSTKDQCRKDKTISSADQEHMPIKPLTNDRLSKRYLVSSFSHGGSGLWVSYSPVSMTTGNLFCLQ